MAIADVSDRILVFKEFMDPLTLTNGKSITPEAGEGSDRESGRSPGSGVHLEDSEEECARSREELLNRMDEAS